KIAETEYKFVEKKAVKHGSHMLEWDVFEAVDSNAKYKVLLMMPIHGEEELTHFHMRYGNDKEELFAKEGWFPTFVKPNTTDKQIIGEIEE
ncbi:MAG: zinc-binding protein, partial [Finegoldia magna]|nr:zinc-binding protein [Finegoldia magna]MDU7501742.1 zinc-binding protein [Finegoldia magna]